MTADNLQETPENKEATTKKTWIPDFSFKNQRNEHIPENPILQWAPAEIKLMFWDRQECGAKNIRIKKTNYKLRFLTWPVLNNDLKAIHWSGPTFFFGSGAFDFTIKADN